MSGLLDVNVLIALGWPNHVHHPAATEWFLGSHGDGWATCPVTESGFVRVSSNPRVVSLAPAPADAIDLLRRLRAEDGHEFWVDDVGLAGAAELDDVRLTGHRQVTDVHLLVLTSRRGGRLVTFDTTLADLVPGAEVEILSL